MNRPKVLVFIDWYLPGYMAGGPVRSLANVVEHLQQELDFHIVTRNSDYTSDRPYDGIVPDQWTTLPGGTKVWYASAKGTNLRTWKQLLRQQAWDTVYINGLYSWWFNILPVWLTRRCKCKRVVAVRGMLASGAMRQGTVKKLLFLSAARMLELYKGVVLQATNAEEARDIQALQLRPAGVAVAANLPRPLPLQHVPIAKQRGAVELVSAARIAPEKNTLLAITALRQVRGTVRYKLYGTVYDEAYWHKCQEAAAQLPPTISVVHEGPVPTDEVPRVLAAAHALYMPSAGENFGHTMLEALSVGRPLLISDRTPWRGLEPDLAGWDLPLADPDAFGRAVEQLCTMDQAEYDRWSQGAYQRAARYLADPRPIGATLKLLRP